MPADALNIHITACFLHPKANYRGAMSKYMYIFTAVRAYFECESLQAFRRRVPSVYMEPHRQKCRWLAESCLSFSQGDSLPAPFHSPVTSVSTDAIKECPAVPQAARHYFRHNDFGQRLCIAPVCEILWLEEVKKSFITPDETTELRTKLC